MAKSGKRGGTQKSLDRQKQIQALNSSDRTWLWTGGIIVVLLIAAVLWFTIGPGKPAKESSMPNPVERNNMYSEPPKMQIDPNKSYVATISTAKGDIVVQLNASAAPLTVNNFVFLANQGFYNDLTFHRVEPGFVIQGGDPAGTGSGGPGYTVSAEIGLKHVNGAIAMARLGDQANPERASSGSQFYITLAPTSFLDGAYTVFGQVTDGMDIVQSIAVGDVIEAITIAE